GYYEVYNQPNVKLVDINETPIGRITPTGIKTSDTEYEFDIIIYATGFDAITGAFDRIAIHGVDGESLKEKWEDGPQTFLGILVDGFPNMLMVMGPHAGLGNFPRAVEYTADWVTSLIRFAHDRALTRIEATAAGAIAWTDHVIETSEGLLFTEVDFVDDRHQPQCRGQAGPPDHALHRRPPEVSRALRCGRGRRISRTGPGLAGTAAAGICLRNHLTTWQGTTNKGAFDGCRHDDGIRQLRLGRLLRRTGMGRGDS